MKKYIFLILSTILFSCTNEKIEHRIQNELSKGELKNDIFLDFMFGDSIDEVQKKIQKLSKNGSIIYPIKSNMEIRREYLKSFGFETSQNIPDRYYWIDDTKFHYIFPTSKNDNLTGIHLDFYEDKLCELDIIFEENRQFSEIYTGDFSNIICSGTEILFREVVEIYKNKYGLDFLEKQNIEPFPNDKIWVDGNRKITIRYIPHWKNPTVKINYFDTRIDLQKEIDRNINDFNRKKKIDKNNLKNI